MKLALALALVAALLAACRDGAQARGRDAGTAVPRAVRVPAALMVERGLDVLGVSVDASTLGLTELPAQAGAWTGLEVHARVFPRGSARPVLERSAVAPGLDFAAATLRWSSATDGVPVQGTRYEVEEELVLFETDVPPGPGWKPRDGTSRVLWSRTLRQAEE